MTTVYVVAGSTQEYERWLSGPGTVYETEIKLLNHAGQLNIMQPTDRLVLLKGWQCRSDWRAIYNRMLATGRRGSR